MRITALCKEVAQRENAGVVRWHREKMAFEESFEEWIVDKARKSPEILSSLELLECEV